MLRAVPNARQRTQPGHVNTPGKHAGSTRSRDQRCRSAQRDADQPGWTLCSASAFSGRQSDGALDSLWWRHAKQRQHLRTHEHERDESGLRQQCAPAGDERQSGHGTTNANVPRPTQTYQPAHTNAPQQREPVAWLVAATRAKDRQLEARLATTRTDRAWRCRCHVRRRTIAIIRRRRTALRPTTARPAARTGRLMATAAEPRLLAELELQCGTLV